MGKHAWELPNGERFRLDICNINYNWPDLAGIYIFAYEDEHGWHALYIGQTENLRSHFPRNKLLDEAVRRGCTNIHAIDEVDAAKREEVVKALIQQHQPPMNSQQTD